MSAQAYPLAWPAGWPRTEARHRKASTFRTDYMPAFENLMNELRLLGARNVVVSTNAPLRRDGRPYTDAMTDDLDDPGVAVWFALNGEPRVMARDGHPTPAENLHAIGHVITHLRGLNRHGGAYMMTRAFSGFTALPAPGGHRHWSMVLGISRDAASAESVKRAYANLAKRHHPDVGGNPEVMAELNRARDEAMKEIAP